VLQLALRNMPQPRVDAVADVVPVRCEAREARIATRGKQVHAH
jgi:hypothetical protein